MDKGNILQPLLIYNLRERNCEGCVYKTIRKCKLGRCGVSFVWGEGTLAKMEYKGDGWR